MNDVYFVDACEEVASTGNRDYWMGKASHIFPGKECRYGIKADIFRSTIN